MNPIIVALDYPQLEEAARSARALSSHVGGFKVGLELLMGEGMRAIELIAGLGPPVFADAKLHDIPNTVEGAARQISSAGARWVTVHASGGAEMMQAADEAMGGTGVLAVTVLTSLDGADLKSLGIGEGSNARVRRLARLAHESGAEGIVCSPEEAAEVKGQIPSLHVFTPGVRPQGASQDDQRRVATPRGAVEAGADFIVVGRPITRADDMVAAAESILESISRGP